jgi:sugar/nucleoside kinase (ribokinase family)
MTPPKAVVAGHICLDIIPAIRAESGGIDEIFVPGKLVNVGPAVIATGGAVSNTGLSLHRLGIDVKLMGKIGQDSFGQAVRQIVRGHGESLADGMIESPDDATSYTVVINPPKVDRIFLHCPGANDTFKADDIDYDRLAGCALFHFGYPPLMQSIYSDGGQQLERIMQRAKQQGVATSLDMAYVEPNSPSGQVDWSSYLQRILPAVDIFTPSADEILYMIQREKLSQLEASGGDVNSLLTGGVISQIADQLIAMGSPVVLLKLGEHGLYLRTSGDRERIGQVQLLADQADAWAGRELFSTVFTVDVVGTTGAGDCTIAGFLNGLLRGGDPIEAMTSAVATGAASCESADAVSGVSDWNTLRDRIEAGWSRQALQLELPEWQSLSGQGLYAGPNDRTV